MIKTLKTSLHTQRRKAWIYSYDTFTKYPFQVNTYGLPDTIKRKCIEGFKKVARKKGPGRQYKNYEEWVYSKFGKGIADYFYLPYSEKFWTVPAREMTTDWLDVRVPIPSLKEVIEGSRCLHQKEYGPNAVFRYPPRSGISKLPESFSSKIKKRISLDKEAVQVDPRNKLIIFKDSSSIFYKTLISTMPLPELFAIMDDAVPSEVIGAVKGLRCNSILSVNVGIKKPIVNNHHWIYYPEDSYSFFRISFPKNFCSALAPRDKSSINAEIAYSPDRPVDKRKIADKVVRDLIRGKVLEKKDKVEFVDVQDVKYGYPIYDHNRRKNMKIIEDYLRRFDIYTAGRYGKWEYQWMDDAILDGKRVAQEVNGR